MSFGKIYETTWFGSPVKDDWGGIYFYLPYNEITLLFQDRVNSAGGTIEALSCVNEATSGYTIDFLLKDENGFLLQENGFKIII